MAKDLGGKRQPGSGSKWNAKGDVRTDVSLVECKTTDKMSYSLKTEVLDKIQLEAMQQGKYAILALELGNGRRYAVVDWDMFAQLQGEATH